MVHDEEKRQPCMHFLTTQCNPYFVFVFILFFSLCCTGGVTLVIKTIKVRVKGGQPAMPCGASWLAAVRNLLHFLDDEDVDYFLNVFFRWR